MLAEEFLNLPGKELLFVYYFFDAYFSSALHSRACKQGLWSDRCNDIANNNKNLTGNLAPAFWCPHIVLEFEERVPLPLG